QPVRLGRKGRGERGDPAGAARGFLQYPSPPPLTAETRKLMNDAAFSKMKPSAFVINCSRGPVIDTEALVRALDAKRIAGCALDTTDPEPLPDPHPLRGRDNVIVVPHAAWYSEQAMAGLQAGAPRHVRRL